LRSLSSQEDVSKLFDESKESRVSAETNERNEEGTNESTDQIESTTPCSTRTLSRDQSSEKDRVPSENDGFFGRKKGLQLNERRGDLEPKLTRWHVDPHRKCSSCDDNADMSKSEELKKGRKKVSCARTSEVKGDLLLQQELDTCGDEAKMSISFEHSR